MNKPATVVVIGAGVGGLVTALRLAKTGFRVSVLEQGSTIGGKLNLWEPDVPGVGRFRFDTGPHVLTMPWAIRALFSDLGERMEDYLDLVRMDPICRYHFPDAPPFDAPADPEQAVAMVAERFPGEEAGVRRYIEYARRIHDATVEPFLSQDFGAAVRGIPTPRQWRQLRDFLALRPWKTLRQVGEEYLRHPRLRQIFDLYAFYNGSSPDRASAIFAIIAWVQWGDGTFYLRGGLRTYAEALGRLAERFGVEIRTRMPVCRVLVEGVPGRARTIGVETADGKRIPADVVVCNADPLTAYEHLLSPRFLPPAFQPDRRERLQPSTSAFVLLLGVRGDAETEFSHLEHFNSFLPTDPEAEFKSIFKWNLPADDPVIGVTCQSRTEPGCAPPGYTNLFVMTSPPPLSPEFAWTPENTAAYRDRILTLLEGRGGMPGLRERIVCEQIWTPETFQNRYGAYRGSLYGLSSNDPRSAFLRPPNRMPEIANLFFVGGGTHPGGGLPMVTLGGKIVAETVQRTCS
ncbi:MAG: phytoene desaturase family protein [Armatimonadaceae bacterium]